MNDKLNIYTTLQANVINQIMLILYQETQNYLNTDKPRKMSKT